MAKTNEIHKPGGGCKFRKKLGCANCGANRGDPIHFGAPPSINVLGSGDPMLYQSIKQRWQAIFSACLDGTTLPRGLAHIAVDGVATFPDRARRDQGNYRALIEKALGDAFVEGGWLDDDDWTHYEFGSLSYAYEAGRSSTQLFIFPRES